MAEAPVGGVGSQEADTMDAGVAVEDFLNTGRTGRRNAVADINDPRVGTVTAAGVDFSFDKLSVSDSKPATPDPSKSGPSGPGEKSEGPKS